MAYLAAMAVPAGVPLFVRTKGNPPPLSFPVIASLSTVHVYAENLKAKLVNYCNRGVKVLWECYCESILLVLVISDDSVSDAHLSYLLDLLFNAMVLVIGLHQLEEISSATERLKKELKLCFHLLDYLLQNSDALCCVTQSVDTVCVEDAIMQQYLEAFTEAMQSDYGCLLIEGKLCLATERWWSLSTQEVYLLSLLISSLPPSSCRDVPVYLPCVSNKVAHRLLVFSLLEGAELCVLCGPDPTLLAAQELVHRYWSGTEGKLRQCLRVVPRCVPTDLHFDSHVLAFCVVNLESGRSLTTLKPIATHDSRGALSAGYQGDLSSAKKQTYLADFVKTVVDNLLPKVCRRSKDDESDGCEYKKREGPSLQGNLPHRITETYICAKNHKAYAINQNCYNLFALFSSSAPTFGLRTMATDLLHTLTADKTVSKTLGS